MVNPQFAHITVNSMNYLPYLSVLCSGVVWLARDQVEPADSSSSSTADFTSCHWWVGLYTSSASYSYDWLGYFPYDMIYKFSVITTLLILVDFNFGKAVGRLIHQVSPGPWLCFIVCSSCAMHTCKYVAVCSPSKVWLWQ